MGKQMEWKEAAQGQEMRENRPLKSRGNRGTEEAASGGRCGAKGVSKGTEEQEGPSPGGAEASSQGEGFHAGSAVLSRTGMGGVRTWES